MVIRRLAGGRYPWMFQKGPGLKTFVKLSQSLKALNNQVIRSILCKVLTYWIHEPNANSYKDKVYTWTQQCRLPLENTVSSNPLSYTLNRSTHPLLHN